MMLKVCGITRLTDALHATEQGATALGFVFWPRSPRYIEPERAAAIIRELPPAVEMVGVFVDEPVETVRRIVESSGVQVVQLHGDEPADYADAVGYPVFRSTTLDEAPAMIAAWPIGTPLLL